MLKGMMGKVALVASRWGRYPVIYNNVLLY